MLQEGDPGDTDEGRAILQILHDVAPKARLGFATANGGEVNFANNIRALGGFADAPNAQAGFKADIIIDDVIYPTEPMFQDGIVAQAVDDVAAAGVSHFSSAGNRSGSESYDSAVRIVPGRAQSWANTNLDFSGVDPALYAGGFHDFDAGSGRDIAQTIQADGGSLIVFQWNEPFDPEPPTVLQVLAEGTGTVPDGGDTVVTFDGEAGQLVEIFVDGDESGPGAANPDVTFALFDPNGNFIQFVDNTTNPESLILVLPATGTYFVQVDSFTEDQFGDFLYRVSEVEVEEQVLSDYNLLFFLEDGTFIGNFAEQNLFSNRPLEAGGLPGATLQTGGRAREHPAEEQPQRRGPHPLRRLRRRAPAGALQVPEPRHLRPQLGARGDRRRGLSVLPAVHPGVLHLAGTGNDLLQPQQPPAQQAGRPREAGPCGDGRRQHDVLLRGRAGGRGHAAELLRHERGGTRTRRRSARWCCRRPAGRAA